MTKEQAIKILADQIREKVKDYVLYDKKIDPKNPDQVLVSAYYLGRKEGVIALGEVVTGTFRNKKV